jgi:hypothetical protein
MQVIGVARVEIDPERGSVPGEELVADPRAKRERIT